MSEFHFLRPWWLLALAPCLLVIWRLQTQQDPARRWRRLIDSHLLPHLLVEHVQRRQHVTPLRLLAVALGFAVLALSGPTWQREPAPFGDDTAGLVIVLKVTPSMQAEDIQPTRLTRAIQKIHDLLTLRPGAKTALVAYSGTAHRVLPLTTDAAIINSFAGELSPGVMPKEGDVAAQALSLAGQVVTQSKGRGWILWIADSVSGEQLAALQQQAASTIPVTAFAMCAEGPERQSLQSVANTLRLPVVSVTPDEADVTRLAANTRFSSVIDGTGERWRDSGYWLVPILVVISLGWFRRGWVLGDTP